MAVFEYRGILVSSGKQVKGVRDAENAKALRAVLRRDGIMLTSATEDRKAAAAAQGKRGVDLKALFNRPSTGDIALMTRQLATLLKAGVPLLESLNALIEQVEKESLKRVLTQVREQVREGQSFAKSLEQHPKVFPPLYVNMVRAGEASGGMGVIFTRLAEFERTRDDLQGYIISSLIYPALLALVGLGSILVLLNFVVPRFASVFEESRMKMPLPTNTASAPSAMQSAASAGVAIPPAANCGTGNFPRRATSTTSS